MLSNPIANPLPHSLALAHHPATPLRAVHCVKVRLRGMDKGALALTFTLEGDLAKLRVPSLERPRRANRLWEHTCFEAFVGMQGEPAYYEFNVAPSREWAAYRFRAYRDGAPLEQLSLAPEIDVRHTDHKLELDTLLRLHCMPMIEPHARLRLALCAVIEDACGVLSYWALKHPPDEPDFHHPDTFALELDPLQCTVRSVPKVSN